MMYRFTVALAVMALVLGACAVSTPTTTTTDEHRGEQGPSAPTTTASHGDGDDSGEFDSSAPPTTITSHGPPEGGWVTAYLAFDATIEDAAALAGSLAEVAPEAEIEVQEGWMNVDLDSDAGADVAECLAWGSTSVIAWMQQDDPAAFDAMVAVLEAADIVIRIDRASIESEFAFEEALIACESRQVTVWFERNATDSDIDSILGTGRSLDGVVGAVTYVGENPGPDFSGYPAAQACWGPSYRRATLVQSQQDADTTRSIIDALSASPIVTGFGGHAVPESLDPYIAWESTVDWENQDGCERYVEIGVELDSSITDEQAASVTARVVAIPGVADYELHLVDPSETAPCEGDAGNGGHADCYQESSTLIIFRGDPAAATLQSISDAICQLPGVRSIWGEEQGVESDPYETCGEVWITVVFSTSATEDQADAVAKVLSAHPAAISVDGPWGGHEEESPTQQIVVGTLDPVLCADRELAYNVGGRFERVDRREIATLVDQVGSMGGVVFIESNAVDTGFDRGTCGYDGMWFGFTTDTTDIQRQEVYRLFAARDDVIAVIVQQELYPHTEEGASAIGWYAQVRFREPALPPDIDQLVDQLASMPGVLDPDAWMDER